MVTRSPLVLVVLVALASAPTVAIAQLPASCGELGDALTEHTCFHARFGPFDERVAGSSLDGTDAPGIDQVHTHYRVALRPDRAGVVSYTPRRSGAWAVFFEPDIAWTMRDEGGALVDVVVEVPVDDCPHLPRARVLELEAGERYLVTLGPSAASAVVLVLERVSDFDAITARDRDGDGFGDPATARPTPCEVAEGWVLDDTDCDDDDRDVHPGGIEACDGDDDNCDRVIDDIGVTCRAGLGACVARGVTRCDEAYARCDAVPLDAEMPETCDGLDEDCDGRVDESGPALCAADVDAPRCVSTGSAAACGCERDEDCGGPRSGRLCWLDATVQHCVAGCVDGFGRNGCAEGLSCTSRDPARPGICVPTLDAGESERDAGAPDATAATSPERAAGCGCSAAGQRSDTPLLALAGLLLVLTLRSRRARTAVLALLVGCASTHGREDAASAADAGCRESLGTTAVAHACQHVDRGPLVDVEMQVVGSPVAPDVSRAHRAWRVFGSPVGAGELRYRASRDGWHAMLTDRDTGLEVLAVGSDAVVDSSRVEVAGCAALEHAVAVELAVGTEVRIRATDTTREPFVLYVEHLDTFGDAGWAQRCER